MKNQQSILKTLTSGRASLLIKVFVSVGLLALLFYIAELEKVLEKFSAIGLTSMLIVLALLVLQNIVGSLRWAIIIKRLGADLPFKDVFSIYIAGSVSNLVLLTSVGGISVRALLLVKRGVRLVPVIVGLFIERIYVFAALLASFFVGAYILKENLHLKIIDTTVYYAFVLIFVIFAITAFAMLFFRFSKMAHGENISKLFAAVFKHGFSASILMVVSLPVLFLGFTAIGVIASSLEIDAPILLLLSVQPVIAIAASLPISFGGWGVREGGMVLGLSFLQVSSDDALALSILYGSAGVVATLLLAGAVFISGPGKDILRQVGGIRAKTPNDTEQ